MFSKDFYIQIMNYYTEYKEQYDKKNLIGIRLCECDDDTMLAYTNNEELMECIKNGRNVTLYISSRFIMCSEQYIKAVLFHEFTHISDAYNFVGYDNSNILMSTFSEYNAARIEIMERCKNKSITLDKIICGEGGDTTLKEEIEDKIDNVLIIPKMTECERKELLKQGKEGLYFNFLIKNLSYLLAYISFIEITEEDYFKNCFKRLEEHRLCEIVKNIYNNVQNLNQILDNPYFIIMEVMKIYHMYFGDYRIT